MSFKRTDSLEECQRHGLDISATCEGCGRKVVFSSAQLLAHCKRRKLTTMLRWLGQHFVCRGRAEIEGCGHRGAKLLPLLVDPPPPAGPPVATAEWVPAGVDRAAWARADDRQRKLLVRRVRG